MEVADGEDWQDLTPSPATPEDGPNQRRPRAGTSVEEEGDNCRICRGEGTPLQPLFYPCKCSGSIKFVHQDCLMEWLSHSQKKYCELCKTPFRFTKLYDQSMPSTLPLPLFLQQAAVHTLRIIGRWTRYIVVGVIWLCWLPWSIRQIWRGLFWLADGGWISEKDLQEAARAHLSAMANDTSSSAFGLLSGSTNATIREMISSVLPPALAPVSAFLGLGSGELLLIKMIRLLYPNVFRWSLGLGNLNSTDEGVVAMPSDRHPSLLSDVHMINSLTSHALLNNALLDIFEGQLACLLIVTAFILVFLIREWVINQQPIMDMPDPDRPDNNVIAQPQPNEDVVPVIRRRRRGFRRGIDLQELNQEAAGRNGPPRPIPHPPRSATEDNILRVGLADHDASRNPAGRRGSFSSAPETQAFGENSATTLSQSAREPAEDEELQDVSPPLLPPGAFDDAANIHRRIEEAILRQDERSLVNAFYPQESSRLVHDLLLDQEDPLDHENVFAERNEEEDPTNVDHDSLDGARVLSYDAIDRSTTPGLIPMEHSNALLQGNDTFSETLPSNPASESEAFKTEELTSEGSAAVDHSFGESVTFQDTALAHNHRHTLDDHDSIPELELVEPTAATEVSERAVDTSDENEIDRHDEPGQPSPFEPILAWLWQTDGYTPETPEFTDSDDEHVLHAVNAAAEVAQRPDANVRQEDVVNDAPPPLLLGPNVQLEVELNNAEAIEDAEDLDGILELIGVQGPLAGMIQNVIFSEFLITLTVAASVWMPYIWGKIALLILANPVGVFIKAPLYLISRTADLSVDLMLFSSGILGHGLNILTNSIRFLIHPVFPSLSELLDTTFVEAFASTLTKNSGTRLEKTLSRTFFGLKPDLPTFSMQSHHALQVFKKGGALIFRFIRRLNPALVSQIWQNHAGDSLMRDMGQVIRSILSPRQTTFAMIRFFKSFMQSLSAEMTAATLSPPDNMDVALLRWSTQDKFLAILLGYFFFASAGYVYLKLARFWHGLKSDEKVEGLVADSIRQAGGVMKVVVIIGIEMIVFPLYCGFLLDFALMPLFEGVSLHSRCAFMMKAPVTGLFVHWFIGTCYMFHFALFVSMCRKIMRKGVLYFIRDPDDPTFHPIRDVLERPVATQLGKIAFSAFIYGGLVIVCLGGVVWTLSGIGGVLPIRWATSEPRLAFPMDVIFYNFLLPFIVRKADPSSKISVMYEWWFRRCASWLRLTHFLFGEEIGEEKGSHIRRTWRATLRQKRGDITQPVIGEDRRILAEDRELDAYFFRDGTYVRAPATDSVRIPKGERVFLEVNENNERVDGSADQDKGMHGKTDERFIKLYIPPRFQARIATFIFLLWIFAASTGVAITIGPLLLGRKAIKVMAQTELPPNDLYAFTVGVHVCGGTVYAISHLRNCKDWLRSHASSIFQNTRQALPRLFSTVKYVLGMIYLGLVFGVVFPFSFSFLTEIYLHVPFYTFMASETRGPSAKSSDGRDISTSPDSTATVYILQTWMLGLLYLRLILRIAANYPNRHTRIATAIRAITQNGWYNPDVRLATRAFILPAGTLCAVLLIGPLAVARIAITIMGATVDDPRRAIAYRNAYPGVLACVVVTSVLLSLKRQLALWRVKIRDEVYLIGERLHNFQDPKNASHPRPNGRKHKGKGKEKVVVPVVEDLTAPGPVEVGT